MTGSQPGLQRRRIDVGLDHSTSSYTELYFQIIFYIAVVVLWGGSLFNGTVKALVVAVWNGQFENGFPLKTDFTGFPLLDYPLAILVAFFFSGTNGHDEGYQLFVFDVYIILQLGYLWLYVEAIRPGQKPKWIQSPVYLALLWQACGGAVALPLYYGIHIRWAREQRQAAQVAHLDEARALIVAFFVGAVVPMLFLMAPTWLGPEARTATTQQKIIAFFQPSPIYVSCIMTVTTCAFEFRSSGRSPGILDGRDKGQASRCIRGLYLAAAAISTFGRFYVLARVLNTTGRDIVSLKRMYLPFSFAEPIRTKEILVWGPWLFLQWDNIIINLASLSWALILLKQTRKYRISTLLLGFPLGFAIVGPGATVTLALYLREGYFLEVLDEEDREKRALDF